MKLNIEIDCTPDEARAFFGLPDVKPIQQAVLADAEKRILAAAATLSGEKMLETWFAFLPQNSDYFKRFTDLMRPRVEPS